MNLINTHGCVLKSEKVITFITCYADWLNES